MSKYKKFWGIFFSLLFLWLSLRKIDFYAIPKAISAINPIWFIWLVLSYSLEMLTRAIRWLSIQTKEKITFKYSFFGLILTYFFNNILPARAGEFFRPYYYSKKNLAESGETLGAVVLERFFDGVMLLTLILISFQKFTSNDLLKKASIITTIFYAVILIGILLAIFNRKIFEKITNKCFSILPEKISKFLNNLTLKFIDGLSTIKDFKNLFNIIITSILSWASSILTTWIGLKSFGYQENFMDASFVLTVLAISSMIPASPGTLGVYEYFCIFTFSELLGYSSDAGAAFSVVMHGMQYFYIIILGFIILLIEGIKISDFKPNSNSESKEQLEENT